MRSALVLLLVALCCACRSSGSASPYAPLAEGARQTWKAEELTREASELFRSDPARAEELLRDALTADLYHGPAHNNLGILYLHQGHLYEAANEFQWASKLMPGHPDPRLNLGLTLEQAGQVDGALDSYKSAIEVYPEHIPTLQALARLLLGNGRDDERLPEILAAIELRGESEEWRSWAKTQSIRLQRRNG